MAKRSPKAPVDLFVRTLRKLRSIDVQQTLATQTSEGPPGLSFSEARETDVYTVSHTVEDGVEYVVTYQGRPVAVILPLDTERAEAEMVQASKNAVLGDWGQYERLAQQIREAWPVDVSTQDLIDDIRR
jgi:antitoxin (DNA-binding transcriptional repressor) of toxin-antitoxin stability system